MAGRRYVLSVCVPILGVFVPRCPGLGSTRKGRSGARRRSASRRSLDGPESSHSLEKGAAAIDVYGQGVQILLHRHSGVMVKFPRVLPQ